MLIRSPESAELVQLYYRGKVVGMPSVSNLPIAMADAFVVLSQEEIKRDNAQLERDQNDAAQ